MRASFGLEQGGRTTHPLLGMHELELSAPIAVLIEITRCCNLRCLHCFSNSTERGGADELTTAQWREFLDQLAEMQVFLVFYGGGEPLCRDDFMEIATYTRERGMEMCLLTNLTLIDRDMARKLHELGMYKVEGNLDGHDAETYEKLRGVRGSFQRTIEGIRNCLDVGLPVRVNCTLSRLNCGHVAKIVELAVRLRASELAFIRLIPAGRGDDNFSQLDFGERLYRNEILPSLRKLRERYKGRIHIGYEQGEEIIRMNDPNQLMPWCGSGRIHCTVTPTGLVKPDHSFPDGDPAIIAGNILKEDFVSIWQSSQVFHKIRHHRFPECERCRYVGCVGGDVYRIYHHYARLMAGRDPRCEQFEGQGYA